MTHKKHIQKLSLGWKKRWNLPDLHEGINKEKLMELQKTLQEKKRDKKHPKTDEEMFIESIDRTLAQSIDYKLFSCLNAEEIQEMITLDLQNRPTFQQDLIERIQKNDVEGAIVLYQENIGCTPRYAKNMVDHLTALPAHKSIQIFARSNPDPVR